MDARRLLRKKNWTGAETGKALIVNLCSTYAGKARPFPPETVRGMVDCFRDSKKDAEAYNRYVTLQSWIVQYQAVANAYALRLQSCLAEFKGIINTIDAAEAEQRYKEKLPCIMTRKEYEEHKAARIEEILTGGEVDYNLFYLLTLAVCRYFREGRLDGLKELYSGQYVTDKNVITAFIQWDARGYYTLPDGTRSDRVSPEEWDARFMFYSPDLQRMEAEEKEGYSGKPGSLAFDTLTREARAAHLGKPIEEERGAAVWHYYDSIELTKWELLTKAADITSDADFMALYPCLCGLSYSAEEATAEDCKAQAKAFNAEFPELVALMFPELEKLGLTYKGKPLSSVSVDRWRKVELNPKELYSAGWPGFRELVEGRIFAGNKQAFNNGVAILEPLEGQRSAAIDKDGRFIKPNGKGLFSSKYGLDAYMSGNAEQGENIRHIESIRHALEESYSYVAGYDLALQLIAEQIGIPEFTIFSMGAAEFAAAIEAANMLFDSLYVDIQEAEYQDEEEQAAKLQALRDVFYPLKAADIPEDRRRLAAGMLEGLEPFAGVVYKLDFLNVLTEGGAAE